MFSATGLMRSSPLSTTGKAFRRMNRNTSLKSLDRQAGAANIGIPPGLGSLFADSPSKRITERSGLKANPGEEADFGSRSRVAINPG